VWPEGVVVSEQLMTTSPPAAPAIDAARATLIRVLQDAHAGELAAAYAYRGHWKSLRHRPEARSEVKRIEGTEWHHRRLVGDMLANLGSHPRRARELSMHAIGRFFGALCFVSGYFAPMYAAGRLEAMNVHQYRTARHTAALLGLDDFGTHLEEMRAEEDRHERFFGDQVRGHFLLPIARRLWGWSPPPVEG
jgi:demethoxyubiquinone hydroxylase (CLK1/Coq7/Cat5 family)